VAFSAQTRGQQRPDEPAGAGDEDAHRSDDDVAAR
jgi:hypothetical protein